MRMNNDSRLKQLTNWLTDVLHSNDFHITVASADASFRRYFRVQHQQQTWIAMDAPPDKEDCQPFIDIAQLIEAAGVQSPHIFHKDLKQGFMLLSDLGSTPYLKKLDHHTVDNLYTDALHALHKMQNIQAELPLYSAEKLQQEMDLFNDWFLKRHLNISLNENQQHVLTNCFEFLIDQIQQQAQVFVHRDYHSRNLMITEENNPGVIDFQDAVIGAYTYDLVSLLKDCYISWPRKIQLDFVEQFYHQLPHKVTDLENFIKQYDLMGLQRHIKVAGIFCRLNYRDGKDNYLNDLPLTIAYIIDVCSRYQETQGLLNLLSELNISADNTLLKSIQ